MSWYDNFSKGFIKKAIDKLSDDEQPPTLPTPDPIVDKEESSASDTSSENMPPILWNNRHLVVTPGAEFIVELIPQIVTGIPGDATPAPIDPMANTSSNPNANPALLDQWLEDSADATKPYSHNDQGTIDPLSQQEEGTDPTVKVHKQAYLGKIAVEQPEEGQDSVPVMPGADKSNAYPPCKYCANYIADKGECTQGLDVEKVQAAKSCSWLNSHPGPFGTPVTPSGIKNVENYSSDPNFFGSTAEKSQQDIKDYLRHLWD